MKTKVKSTLFYIYIYCNAFKYAIKKFKVVLVRKYQEVELRNANMVTVMWINRLDAVVNYTVKVMREKSTLMKHVVSFKCIPVFLSGNRKILL